MPGIEPEAGPSAPAVVDVPSRGEVPSDVTIVAHHVGSVGGMERQLTQLIMGLRRRGHQVTVIAYACELPAGAGVTFHRIRGPNRPLLLSHPWFMLMGTIAVWKWRRGVVQATGAIVLNRVDIIAVHYCHQVGPAHPSRANILFRANARAAALLGVLAERLCFAVNRPWRFACVSDGVADEVRGSFRRQADRVVTVHNGVDAVAFSPGRRHLEASAMRARLGIAKDRRVAIFVGGEWGRKGLEPAIQALGLTSGWDLLVVGEGDTERYRKVADRVGVAGRVHWIGVSRDVALLYELADLLVFPSSYEAFPLVVLEAAAAGLAILSTPVNGVRELIRDGSNGFLISSEPEDIAERLRQLAADPALLSRLGRAAREAALEFSWERMIEEHRALYQEAAGNSGAGRRRPVRVA
jgi:UDP-glucose:(heptosyl)LPS alpha-1,3-glucosyltransferase